jgi:hypothetical protein
LPAVEAWLNCDECTDGELAAVRTLGETAVPQLAKALLDGPSPESREVIRQQAMAAYSRSGVRSPSGRKYVTQLVDNYVANHQERAAVALGEIRTPRAIAALDEALLPSRRSQYRPNVLRAIRFARTAIGATPFGGRFERPVVAFGDTAFLLAPPGRPFAKNDVVILDDSVFLPSVLQLSRVPHRIGFAAVGGGGSHMVVVSRSGSPQPKTEVIGLTIASIADANDRAMQGCATRACEVSRSPIIPAAALPYRTFLSLWTAPPYRDSIDLFRFMPAVPLRVTARVDWSGPGNVDLVWRRCPQLTPVGNSSGATASKPESTSESIPAGECWLLLVALNSRLAEPTFAHLQLSSP